MKQDSLFEIDGQSYHSFPTLTTFLEEAGIDNATIQKKILLLLDKEAIIDISQLFSFATRDLVALGISKKYATRMVKHLQRLRRQGKLILTSEEIRHESNTFRYLSTGNTHIDRLLYHANGRIGLRTRTLTEFYGEAGIGKTQLMMTLAVMCLRSSPGWSRPVLFIDTEGAFDIHRFYEVASMYGVSQEIIDENLLVSRAYNFDELGQILTEIGISLRTRDLVMIIVDSIIAPLKTQYPLDEDLTNLQLRQQHLKQVTDQLKSLAQVHNLLAIITNQVRAAITSKSDDIVPLGGNVLSHATDLRFWIRNIIPKKQPWVAHQNQIETKGMQLVSVELVDCGFLSPGNADMLVGYMGTGDPNRWQYFIDHDPRKVDQQQLQKIQQQLFS